MNITVATLLVVANALRLLAYRDPPLPNSTPSDNAMATILTSPDQSLSAPVSVKLCKRRSREERMESVGADQEHRRQLSRRMFLRTALLGGAAGG